ncbi:SMC5-SMC6 complex localization factor protein 1 isoform X1 [Heliangelus exortis]|uniref:SMC5-SMC6 complex localization factor protein 1 isoform X1 n=3 Tax=Heliangelus exortis TaxID=472823 RepID=UPI003A8D0C2B
MACVGDGSQKRVIQLTGFKGQEKKALLKWLLKLDCIFLDDKKYRNCTHLIAKKLCRSEKFLAACAAGKWILTKEYIINSAGSGRWLDETTYEWGYEIEKDSHYSPQMQSAPKRWRRELTQSSAPGAFHGWKVVLLVNEGDKQMASIRRILQAGKATICSSVDPEDGITHIFVNSNIFPMQAQYYPLQYLGDYLLENEIQNTEDTQRNNFLAAKETDQVIANMQLAEMKSAVIKHIYFAEAAKHRFAQKDQLRKCSPEVKNTHVSRGMWHVLEGLVEENLFNDLITELAGQMYSTPPVPLLHSLLEYVLLGNSDGIFYAKVHRILYLVLQCDPPWKSPSMLKYYLDLLQCPICKRGTWSFLEMLVRSCLYCKATCHAVSGREDEQKIVHKTLLKFFLDLVKAEVEFLTKSLVEGTNSQHQQVMPLTVLLKTFWLGSETSLLFTKHINILADWVILSHRELNRKNDAFRREIVGLLNGILGTVVEYWIISSLLMDRNVFHQIADDLAHYIAISCDDFSLSELKMFICSIPSLWLQMYIAEAVLKKMCLQRNITFSVEPLSLQKIVCSYLPALREVGMPETGKRHTGKEKKMRQRPCPGSQRALQMLNGDKQNKVKVLPDLPDLSFPLAKRRRTEAKVEASSTKENHFSLAKEERFYRRNAAGETALHKACISNKVESLVQLLSSSGTDINARDFAGWTPLHEACNHGSTVCVQEILQRCPEVDLLSQVDGVTPLHDALSNGHVEIGKLLLQHGGPILLQQRDSNGKLPLDHVESMEVKQELLNVVHPEENIESFYQRTEQDFYSQQRELWLTLFSKMLLNFCSVYNLSSPFTLTLREVSCSNGLPVMASDMRKMKSAFSADWLVDRYFREVETFEKLPRFLQDISAAMAFFPGEQMKALLATLETMVEGYHFFT